jgi:hypothetical protein
MSDTEAPTELQDLLGILRNQLRGRLRDARLLQRDGRVVLQGIAVNYYAKQLALHLAQSALGTATLVNEIEVRMSDAVEPTPQEELDRSP